MRTIFLFTWYILALLVHWLIWNYCTIIRIMWLCCCADELYDSKIIKNLKNLDFPISFWGRDMSMNVSNCHFKEVLWSVRRSDQTKIGLWNLHEKKCSKMIESYVTYGLLRLIHSFLGASKFSVLKLIEIVILWVYYTIPFGFSLFYHFRTTIFNF